MFMANDFDINLYGVFDSRHVDVCFCAHAMPYGSYKHTNASSSMLNIMKSECAMLRCEALWNICSELVLAHNGT